MAEKKKKFYAVAAGRRPGIYTQWFGDNGAHAQVTGFAGAVYKGFFTRQEAQAFMDAPPKPFRRKASPAKRPRAEDRPTVSPDGDRIIVYTDGGAPAPPILAPVDTGR